MNKTSLLKSARKSFEYYLADLTSRNPKFEPSSVGAEIQGWLADLEHFDAENGDDLLECFALAHALTRTDDRNVRAGIEFSLKVIDVLIEVEKRN